MEAKVINFSEKRALNLIEDGKHHISIGDLDLAAEAFQRSAEIFPTADALTYRAWVLSLKGDVDTAIEFCKKAILLDPDFGNPLNDIGSYLIQKNQLNEAIPWLEKAKKATRYEPKHFPFINLGRIYSIQGKIEKAIAEFKMALEFAPEYMEIQKVLTQLENLKRDEFNA